MTGTNALKTSSSIYVILSQWIVKFFCQKNWLWLVRPYYRIIPVIHVLKTFFPSCTFPGSLVRLPLHVRHCLWRYHAVGATERAGLGISHSRRKVWPSINERKLTQRESDHVSSTTLEVGNKQSAWRCETVGTDMTAFFHSRDQWNWDEFCSRQFDQNHRKARNPWRP